MKINLRKKKFMNFLVSMMMTLSSSFGFSEVDANRVASPSAPVLTAPSSLPAELDPQSEASVNFYQSGFYGAILSNAKGPHENDIIIVFVSESRKLFSFKYCQANWQNQPTEINGLKFRLLASGQADYESTKFLNAQFNKPYCRTLGSYLVYAENESYQPERLPEISGYTEMAFVLGALPIFFGIAETLRASKSYPTLSYIRAATKYARFGLVSLAGGFLFLGAGLYGHRELKMLEAKQSVHSVLDEADGYRGIVVADYYSSIKSIEYRNSSIVDFAKDLETNLKWAVDVGRYNGF